MIFIEKQNFDTMFGEDFDMNRLFCRILKVGVADFEEAVTFFLSKSLANIVIPNDEEI